MYNLQNTLIYVLVFYLSLHTCNCAKINSPRVLLPWFEHLNVNFTFEIFEGGCYSWSLSRDDIIDIEPLYEDSYGHCSRAALVTVSKSCVPPGSVIILAEDVSTGEVLRGDVDIDEIKSLKITSTTWKLFLEEAPEAFEVVAYDEQGNTFSTLDGVSFEWSIENTGNNVGEEPLVMIVPWRNTDYEAPRGVEHLEAQDLRSYSTLLYGQAMGDCRVTVCLGSICTQFSLSVVASVFLTPATASIAPGDTIHYSVVRARAGRLTIQNVAETPYQVQIPHTSVAELEDSISLVRGIELGTTTVMLYQGSTEVATAILTVSEPGSLRVTLRPSKLLITGEVFVVQCVVFDVNGHALTAGDETLIRLSVSGDANVDLLRSTENGTLTDAVARNSGSVTITAQLYSIAGRPLRRQVEGQVSALVVEPLEIIPPELYVAWSDTIQQIQLKHVGGGDEPVTWSEKEEQSRQHSLSVSNTGVVTARGVGHIDVRVHLNKYSHVKDYGRVWSVAPEIIQVSTTGQARVGRTHYLHVALSGTHPETGEVFNFHRCDCNSYAVSLLAGPEPHNVTATTAVPPIEGACCVLAARWDARGSCVVRVSRDRVGTTARVHVSAAPALVWPPLADVRLAASSAAEIPILALGESLVPRSHDTRIAELSRRDGQPPHRFPEIQLFTLKCKQKGDARLSLISQTGDDEESYDFEISCASHVSKIRLEPAGTLGNCSSLYLRPGHEVKLKVTLFDAAGRELLDERGPRVSWEISPRHVGLEYRAADRLFIETHPDYAPVPVPFKYYQVVVADNEAIGWKGTLKANIPDASSSIPAIVVAPLSCDPIRVDLAWEKESITDIATIKGGSGRYAVESSKGATAAVDAGKLHATVPSPGSYQFVITDLCVAGEKQLVEVNIEEILSLEVQAPRAICVDECVPISVLVRGTSGRYLSRVGPVLWNTEGLARVSGGSVCGEREGVAVLTASFAQLTSDAAQIIVFPPLKIIPSTIRIPLNAHLQLTHEGGPPAHLATLHYESADKSNYVEVSESGLIFGVWLGSARVKLTARDKQGVDMTSVEAKVEVVPITSLQVRSATRTLLVGSPGPLWLEAEGLSPAVLRGLQPTPRVTWTVRDPASARLYTTHVDDLLSRSTAEGLAVRVVPLRPGPITIDVRVRKLGQIAADTNTWDSSIDIIGISDIVTSVEGLSKNLTSGDRVAVALGSTIRLKSSPKSDWQAYSDGVIQISNNGDLKALKSGTGFVVASNKDEINHISRETVIHVEVAPPHYCTAEPSSDGDDAALRVVLRNSVGRELLAPDANVTTDPVLAVNTRKSNSALGPEVLAHGADARRAYVTFTSRVGAVVVRDEVWLATSQKSEQVLATASWAICLDGLGWRAPPSVSLYEADDVTLAVLNKDEAARHLLRAERPPRRVTIQQLSMDKLEFLTGDWSSSLVPLATHAPGLSGAGVGVSCSQPQRDALSSLASLTTLTTLAPLAPFTCHTRAAHHATPVIDVLQGIMGCSVEPGFPIKDATDIELCAEMGAFRTCTRTTLFPLVTLSTHKISLLEPPATFTIQGHPRALNMVKVTPSPGLKLQTTASPGEITIEVKSDDVSCGLSWVTVQSKLTAQELRVDVEKECDVACGTLLGAIFSLLKPYLPTLVTVGLVVGTVLYAQSRLNEKNELKLPKQPHHTGMLPPSPSPARAQPWSRSPYASAGPVGPAAPVYGDASTIPDNSFSPNSTRVNSRFL